MGFIEEHVPKILHQRLSELKHIDILGLRAEQGLSEERIHVLQSVLHGTQEVDHPITLLNIHLYGLSAAFPEDYRAASVEPHVFACDPELSYDPVKNGYNVIKHGITFEEARSSAAGFGTLMVPYKNKRDGRRYAVFSRLVLHKEAPLLLPTDKIRGRSDQCIMTVAIQAGDGFRFINSRIFGEDDWEEALNNAAVKIYPEKDESDLKKEFMEECRLKVNSNLFGEMAKAGDHGPIRLIKPEDQDK